MTTQGTEDHAMSSTEFSNPAIRWIDYRLPIFTFLHHELHEYPARFRPVFRVFFWILVADCVLLTYAGGKPPAGTWLFLTRIGAAYYFLHFLVVLPLVGVFETPLPLPFSIGE